MGLLRSFEPFRVKDNNDKNVSIDRKLSSLRGFYKYLANNGLVKNNVFSLVSGLKKDKKLPRYFEYNELEELFTVPDLTTPTGLRDRLILEMLYATGVRVGELVTIKVKDINLSSILNNKVSDERLTVKNELLKHNKNIIIDTVIKYL